MTPAERLDKRLGLDDKRTLQILFGILLGSIALRVAWISLVPTQPVTDFDWYFTRATEIARGLGYQVDGAPTAYWPVGYPAALGLVLFLLGPFVEAGKAFNTLLTVVAAPLTFWVAERLYRSRATALLAALMVAIHPSFVAYSSILASEPLFCGLVLLGTLWLLRAGKGPALPLAAGVAFGLAILVRPQAALLPLLVVLPAWLGEGGEKKRFGFWGAAASLAIGMTLICGPWIARCRAEMGSLVFISTNGGDNLLIGHHPGADGRYKNPDRAGLDRPAGLTEVERDKRARRRAVHNIRTDPAASLRLIPAKLAATFHSGTDSAYWAFQTERGKLRDPGRNRSLRQGFLVFRSIGSAAPLVVLSLAALALAAGVLARARRRLPIPAIPWLMAGSAALLSAVFFGNPRFLFPTLPFLAMIGASLPLSIYALAARPTPEEDATAAPDGADRKA